MQQDNWVDSMATKYSLQEEEIRYLRTIHQLFQTVDDVRMIDLAHCLHEGTGKVSYWIKKLREKGIIETDPKGFITLVQSNPGDMDENSDGRETQTIDISRSSLSLSEIKYLLAIQKLSQTHEIVRGSDLCQELGYSSAAVTNALKKLKDKNCIVVAANGAIIIGKSEDIKAINTDTNRFSGRLDLSSSEMTYLNAIDELRNELPVVRAIDIARKLGVSKPSVSVALGKMRTKGLIGYASNGSIIIIDENDNTVHPTVDQTFSSDSKADTQEDADQDYCEESVTPAQQNDEEQAKEEPIHSTRSESVTEQHESIGETVSRNVKQVGLTVQKKDRQDASAVILVALMDELRRRYPTGTYVADMRTLKQDNPDVPWALLANNAKRVYGKPLVPYLEEVGILQKAGTVIQQSASVDMNVDENHASLAVLPGNQSCDEAEEQARREAEEQARRGAEEQARREAEEQARREAEEQARREAEEQARREAEEQARREAVEQARQEAEEQARREAEEQARREAEEQARREAEEQARREAEEQARREAEEQARREAEERERREVEEQARREAEKQARREAEEQARREAEEQARREAEERGRREVEEQARREAEEQARREAEERERQEAEEQARREADELILVEKANSLSDQITELEKQMEGIRGIFGMLKRKKLQARIDELTEQLKAMSDRR